MLSTGNRIGHGPFHNFGKRVDEVNLKPILSSGVNYRLSKARGSNYPFCNRLRWEQIKNSLHK